MCSSEFAVGKGNFRIKDFASETKLVDILKVHDHNYVQKIIQFCNRLKGSDNKVLSNFDNQDTVCSEKTWKAALLSSGAVIEACDEVMNG
jgi:acetoin utilization deacetylase AcuC-like enzyme